MEPELQHQYSTMINHVISDNTEQAQAVLSNILAAKMAARLQAHNADMMTLNRTMLNTPVAPAATDSAE